MKARKVTDSTLDMVSKHVDIEDIYVTRTIEQSDQSLDEIIEKGYPLVLCGGGDGTVMRIIEQMRLKVEAHNKAGRDYKVPKFGMLKLGTGNGWAGLLDTPPGVKPIWAIRQRTPDKLVYTPFNMMEAEGRMFHFGGFGLDALILNDYIDLKQKYTEGWKWKVANSLAGYLIAIGGKSIPKILLKGFQINMKIYNESDAPVYKVSCSGGIEETDFKKGDLLIDTPCDASIFGTTSDYGFKLRVMPFATAKEDYFHLRTSNVGGVKNLAHIRELWTGTIEHERVFDFLVKEVRFEADGEAPFQLGGDPEGYRSSVHLKISDFKPEILDFRKIDPK
jgi:diacylglycerol kinase family enzyme